MSKLGPPISYCLPTAVLDALQRHAERETGGNRSAVVRRAMEAYLTASGDLAPDESDHRAAHDALARLIETVGAGKAVAILNGAQAASRA